MRRTYASKTQFHGISPPEGGEPPLEWKTPYPQPLLARGSSLDLLPDAVSPLFITLGMPIVTKVYMKMHAEVMGLGGEDVPIFEVINGYIFLCFVKSSKFWKYMLVHGSTAGKLYEYGKVLAEEARAKCHKGITRWRQMDLAKVKASELLAGARELFQVSAEYLNASVDRPIPQSNFSEMFFSLFYNTLIKCKADPAAATFLLGLENLPLRAEKSLFDLWLTLLTVALLVYGLWRGTRRQVGRFTGNQGKFLQSSWFYLLTRWKRR